MKIKKITFVYILLIAMIMLASCRPTERASDKGADSGLKAWFDAPLPNSVFVPPNPVTLVMHASDAQGITSFELSANGAVVAEIPSPNTSDSLVTLTYEWHPPEPGRYLMTVRANNNSGTWSPYADTVVIVSTSDIPQAVLPTGSPTPTETATHQPVEVPPTPINTPQRATISFESLSTNMIYFRGNGCGPKDITVQVRAMDPGGIQVIVLFYQIESKSGNGATGFASVGMSSIGGDLYQAILNPESLYGVAALSNYGEAWLDLQAVIQNSSGDTSTRTNVLSNTTVAPCGNAPLPQPTATLPLRKISTNTPIVIR